MFSIAKDKLLFQGRIDPYSREHNGGDSHSKYKNAFLSDLERILFSSSFRRLQDKAQVYPLETQDFVRTRLTHSLEVSALASSLGNIIVKRINSMLNDKSIRHKKLKDDMNEKEWKQKNREINQMIAQHKNIIQDTSLCLQCASLLHDIGNPPFGHFGEDVIKKYFFDIFYTHEKKDRDDDKRLTEKQAIIFNAIKNNKQMKNDLVHFDGNAQTIRIVAKLQNSTSKKYGLNLTYGVLGSLFKYPYSSQDASFKHEKFGYLYSEEDLIEKLKKLNTPNSWKVYEDKKRNPLSLIMEASDDIAYTISDFEDAIQKESIKFENLYYISKNISKYTAGFKQESIDKCEKFIQDILEYYESNANEGISEPLRSTISRMISLERENLKTSVAKCFIENYDVIVKGNFSETLIDKSDYAEFYNFLSKIKKHFVFSQDIIIVAELQGKKIINFLLKEFIDSVLSKEFSEFIKDRRETKNENHKVLQLISKNYVEVYKKVIKDQKIESSSADDIYFRIRMVIDHICGMTDSYAKDTYLKLMGTR
ncbi:MAG: dNTP triphosphohydrolase [Firmicutes bacterium]|nr:dNTP triphosphohydrolase [Bacillota bacterium]